MPSKKKKYNARFPAGRIKKIMQTDEEVGKVAQAVPVIISRTLELFVESLLTKSMQITQARNAKTLTPSHMKQCILSESRFDFLKDLVKNIPDASTQEDNENNAHDSLEYSQFTKSDDEIHNCNEKPPEIAANFYKEQGTSAGRTPVIQYSPRVSLTNTEMTPTSNSEPKLNITIDNLNPDNMESKIQINVASYSTTPPVVTPTTSTINDSNVSETNKTILVNAVSPPPPLIPIASNVYGQSSDNLYIDEDYDN